MIIPDSVIYNCGRMGIEDHFLQEFQDIYQSKTFQYKSDKWVVSSNNVLYSGYRQEFIDHILQE